MTVFSLSEIEALARKSARGAGMSWGVAEDAGKATRWLTAAGLPGADLLAGLLSDQDGLDWHSLCPDLRQSPWRARGGTLCPIATGTAMSDLAHRWAEGDRMETGPIRAPLLLVPFMVGVSDRTDTPLSLSWEGLAVQRKAKETFVLETSESASGIACANTVSLGTASATSGRKIKRSWRANVSAQTVERLGAYAQRLYAPETPERRAAGAGATRLDPE